MKLVFFGSTAIANRNYYENLKNKNIIYKSMHYIIGLDGEIINLIPEDEISYSTKNININNMSISVEFTCIDSIGKLNKHTYNSLIELLYNLTKKYKLDSKKDIIRKYDVDKVSNPKYYIKNITDFIELKNDIKNYI